MRKGAITSAVAGAAVIFILIIVGIFIFKKTETKQATFDIGGKTTGKDTSTVTSETGDDKDESSEEWSYKDEKSVLSDNTDNAGKAETGKSLGADGIKPDKDAVMSTFTDLDGDNKKELIEILQRTNEKKGTNEIEGILKVTGSFGIKTVTYLKKQASLTGVFSNVDFIDLDGDGCKEVFITIPDNGASFSLNYFFIYNYKTNRSFTYTPQAPNLNLAGIAQGFAFKYCGKGKLNILNENYKFSGYLDLTDAGIPDTAEAGDAYNRSWVEPAPLEIGRESKLSLIGDKPGEIYIRLPLAIFGQVTSDLIGEVDVWYKVERNLTLNAIKFEVFDYNRDMTIKSKVGEIHLK